jgi:thioester reductase-like protein
MLISNQEPREDPLTTAQSSSLVLDHAEASTSWADADLAPDIVPTARLAEGHTVLLTGATGFLGRHVARELLERQEGDVYCLARSGKAGGARERVEQALLAAGTSNDAVNSRLYVLDADLTQPRLGISEDQYGSLAHSVASIVHCAADVSWVQPYSKLRAANVLPVTSLLRLACHGQSKHFALISSLGVCYSSNPHVYMSEDSDPLTHVSTMPLGYAQSKAVAERLVRHAVRRGLDASIFRPALISGDSDGRHANAEDFVSMLLSGCIRLGYAPDSDWQLDVVPVNFASRAIVANLGRYGGLRTLHLAHPKPRVWRELILFLNLYGYTIQLEPFLDWRRRLEQHPDLALPLKRLLRFFTNPAPGSAGQSVYQVYEASGRIRISSARSNAHLAAQNLHYPRLSADYFASYLTALRRSGILERPRRERAECALRAHSETEALSALLPHDPTWRPAPFEAHGSIVTEIASWRYGGGLGLYGVAQGDSRFDRASLILKIKALDEEAIATAIEVATISNPLLGHLLGRFSDQLQLGGADARETSFYAAAPSGLLELAPRCLAQGRHPETGRAMLLLERLEGVELLNSVDQPRRWTDRHFRIAIHDLARIHAIGYGDATPERSSIRDVKLLNPDLILQALPLHQTLVQAAEPFFEKWGGSALVVRVGQLIGDIATWIPRYADQPRTLIHNDCNPRNMAFRRIDGNLRTCWYDWELCTWAPPQRDLAELLCFTLDIDGAPVRVHNYIELHRRELSLQSGCDIEPRSWIEGFRLALAELMVRRLTLYTLLHSSVRQSYLPRVVRTWQVIERGLLNEWREQG